MPYTEGDEIDAPYRVTAILPSNAPSSITSSFVYRRSFTRNVAGGEDYDGDCDEGPNNLVIRSPYQRPTYPLHGRDPPPYEQ